MSFEIQNCISCVPFMLSLLFQKFVQYTFISNFFTMFRKNYIFHQKFKAKHPIVDVMAFRHEVDVNTLERTKCIIDIKKNENKKRDIEFDISRLTPLEQSYHFIPTFHSYNPSGDNSKVDNRNYCQHCLCPTYYCANTMFGYDMLYYMKKSAAEFGITFFGKDDDNISGSNDEEAVKERINEYFTKLYSHLVFAKSVNNGIDFATHNFSFDIATVPLPKCVEDGVLKEFLDWQELTDTMIELGCCLHYEYEPDQSFIDYFVNN